MIMIFGYFREESVRFVFLGDLGGTVRGEVSGRVHLTEGIVREGTTRGELSA